MSSSNCLVKGNIVKVGSIRNLGSKNKISGNGPAKPDLKVAKIKRKGKYRYVYIKNIGKAKAKANKLGIYIGKKWIKTVKVKAIKAGKSIRIKVFIPKKYRAKVKTFKVDIKNKVKESREKNNARKSR